MNEKYAKILHMEHHVSKKHPQMSAADRAAQFSPFAALTGYDATVEEAGRLTDKMVELDEYEIAAIDGQIQLIKEHLSEHPEVSIVWFKPDERKSGGSYVTTVERVKKIEELEGLFIMESGLKVPVQGIIGIEIGK